MRTTSVFAAAAAIAMASCLLLPFEVGALTVTPAWTPTRTVVVGAGRFVTDLDAGRRRNTCGHGHAFPSSPRRCRREPDLSMGMRLNFGRSPQSSMAMGRVGGVANDKEGSGVSPLFGRRVAAATSTALANATRRFRRALTVLIASALLLVSSARIHSPPAHAAAAAPAAAVSRTSRAVARGVNRFFTRPTDVDRLVDSYVRDRLFDDDKYDPVESAYREAFADAKGGPVSYPEVLTDAASSVLGKEEAVAAAKAGGAAKSDGDGAGEGVVAAIVRLSDFLQKRLKLSAAVSYYVIVAGAMAGIVIGPAMLGMSYSAFQRWSMDRHESKLYGGILDMDATTKQVVEEEDEDEEEPPASESSGDSNGDGGGDGGKE